MQAEALARATLCSASGAPTTAQPRPQTYVPEALGIPKPYGGFSLFKPSPAACCGMRAGLRSP